MKKPLLLMLKLLPIVVAVVLMQLVFTADSQAAPDSWGGTYHKVHYGETLYSIGRMYGVNPYAIAHANGLHNPNLIYAGQVLYIPAGQGYYPKPEQPIYHPKPKPPVQHPPTQCPGHNPCQPHTGYGYDYTGYYYYYSNGPSYKRYSYTCGYYYNCY